MALQIRLDESVQKQLKALRKAGGRMALIADHAESVMEKLTLASEWDLKQAGRRTRHGEARIKNCIKFDLVDGYRLLGIRREQGIIFLYIGNHDECGRWIRNNNGLQSVLQRGSGETVPLKEIVPDIPPREKETELDAAARDDYPTTDLDEKTLRKIFRGLTGE